MKTKQFDEAAYYILKRIQLNAQPGSLDEFGSTLDVLERIIEILRIRYRCRDNNMAFEKFIQGKIVITNDILNYNSPSTYSDPGSGTASIRLQPKLLLFLLLHHRNDYKVYDIIDNFISKIWDSLDLVDFKKTQTGVTRCFTNTRFAANTLRDYGFLKFTKREAYKTWVLSLPGFLVASKVLEDGNWRLPDEQEKYKSGLHSVVLNAWDDLSTYDKFVGRLSAVCEPNVKVFDTFEDVLKKAYSLLNTYWIVIRNHDLNNKERKLESIKLLNEIEESKRIEEFYKDFSMCLNVDMLLKSLK